MKNGDYYKSCGGYAGVVWNGRSWTRFECDACGTAMGVLLRRIQGPITPTAMKAMRCNAPVFVHDVDIHNRWLVAKSAYRTRHGLADGMTLTTEQIKSEYERN